MSLRKKVLGIALAGALLGAGAMSAERKSDEPQPRSPPRVTQSSKPAPRPQAPPRASTPTPRSESRPSQPRADSRPAPRGVPNQRPAPRPSDHRPEYRAQRHRPPIFVPPNPRIPPQVSPQHRYDTHRHYNRHWDSCRYDPWWRSRWDHWDMHFQIWAGWPYWNTWGWDNRPYYRVYEEQGTVRTFEVMPPPGYDEAVVAYFRSPSERTIRVELARQTRDGIELTVLRDKHADGSLEEAVSVEAATRDGAQRQYLDARERDRYQLPWAQADSLYDFLYDEIREKL